MSFRHIRKYIAINDYSTISITHETKYNVKKM